MDPVYRAVIGGIVVGFRARRWDVRVTGAEHVPATGSAVLASNHIGYLDFTFIGFGARLQGKRLVRFAAKQETFDHPVSGPLMRAMRHIPVDRGGQAATAIDVGVDLLRDGELVGMFPEATISESFVPMTGKTGTVRMAMSAGAPIIPVAVWGSQRLWTKRRPRDLRSGVTVTVTFGAPLAHEPDEDPEEVTDRLMAQISEMVAEAASTYPQSPRDDADRWWLPAHLGGTAPTPEDAAARAEEAAARRRLRRQAELEQRPPTV